MNVTIPMLAAVTALAGANAQPVAKTAGKQWTVIPHEFGCALTSQVEASQRFRRITLYTKPSGSVSTVNLELSEPEESGTLTLAGKIGTDAPRRMTAFSSPKEPRRLSIQFEDAELAKIEQGAALLLAFPKSETLVVDMGAINLFRGELETCNRAGLEAALGAPLPDLRPPTPAKGTTVGIFKYEDYPAEAIKAKQQGLMAVVFVIDAKGRMSRCVAKGPPGTEILERKTCSILKERARFTPAKSGSGQAIESVDRTWIRWDLPTTTYR